MILFSPYVQTLFIVETIILIMSFIALFWAIKLFVDFDQSKTTSYQYSLNKKSYLISTIVMFTLAVKLPLFLFFVWVMDSLSLIVPGAMCAAGIVSASELGTWMLGIKIINLFSLSLWLLLHNQDKNSKDYPFTKLKFGIFQILFVMLGIEFVLMMAHFSKITTDVPVLCCSVLFEQNTNTAVSLLYNEWLILGLFYGLFFIYALLGILRKAFAFGISASIWMLVCIHALIRFFSSYVYELPTHKCPFCLLQSDYMYIGYVIYILMFIGAFSAVGVSVLKLLKRDISIKWYRVSLIANTLLLLIMSAYPIVYYIRNGVWL